MSWDQYRSVMEQCAIKTDDMATEDAYFLATHRPFSHLEVFEGGKTYTEPKLYTEAKVFDELICNTSDVDRMIIVRGNNGTGKSHLIRFMKARLENSPATVYNPETEQIIFLRRLNNSVRGAFSQLLEQNAIQDSVVLDKLRKFVASSVAKDEESFKTEILFAFIASVTTDKTGTTYKPVICRNIAQYLSDSRVQEHLLRQDGAISRCYRMITAPSSEVLKETLVFRDVDFTDRKVNRNVMKSANPEAQDFASTIKNDDDEINKLVKYLNKLTPSVIQRCADISTDDAKSVFEQLRKDLKKQGKNLTLFIEDFTGFTGIDSELITALSAEHGGSYDDLCRVTSIIGITDGYYDQFKDNFTDRVTHQISVTERSYGDGDFLIQMAARYLNAIYCSPLELSNWYSNGADLSTLPIADFKIPCAWDSEIIDGKEFTLYPFNKAAIIKLYNSLPEKTPRKFLQNVIRDQLKEYFAGKKYGDEWEFPINTSNMEMSNGPHSSAIDRLPDIETEDKNRIKSLIAIWGDGSANIVQRNDGTIYIGGINKAFWNDIGLGFFPGIGETKIESSNLEVATSNTSKTVKNPIPTDTIRPVPKPPVPKKVDTATKNYNNWKADINAWFNANTLLQYHADYRTWFRDFLCGKGSQCGAINWQDIGVPAYIANERLATTLSYYIEGQSDQTNEKKALIIIDKSPESRDAITALMEYQYRGSWDFEGAIFYQQKLISWLERKKADIISYVLSAKTYEEKLPITDWCLSIQYLVNLIVGTDIDTSSDIAALKKLSQKIDFQKAPTMSNKDWGDLISFLKNESATYSSSYDLFMKSLNTTMGSISNSKDIKTHMYHSGELVASYQRLVAYDWNIFSMLAETKESNFLYHPAILLKKLYPRIDKVIASELQQYKDVRDKLISLVGGLDESQLLIAINSIQDLFRVFGQNGILGYTELKIRFEGAPIDIATKILSADQRLASLTDCNTIEQLRLLGKGDLDLLRIFLKDLQEIERIALLNQNNAQKALKGITGNSIDDAVTEAAKNKMNALYEKVEAMEVITDVD